MRLYESVAFPDSRLQTPRLSTSPSLQPRNKIIQMRIPFFGEELERNAVAGDLHYVRLLDRFLVGAVAEQRAAHRITGFIVDGHDTVDILGRRCLQVER